MKNLIFFLLTTSLLFACHTSFQSGITTSSTASRFSQYDNLADALRHYSELSVRAAGAVTDIRLSRYRYLQNSAPLYVIDGKVVGNSYKMTNEIITMDNIRSIRVLRSANELIRYGSRGKYGVIYIRTLKVD